MDARVKTVQVFREERKLVLSKRSYYKSVILAVVLYGQFQHRAQSVMYELKAPVRCFSNLQRYFTMLYFGDLNALTIGCSEMSGLCIFRKLESLGCRASDFRRNSSYPPE